MTPFMSEDFLLTNNTAKKLYHDYAKKLPVIDYHCHINPEHIACDVSFDNITKLWLDGDHYKWRLMRLNGIDEKYITGDADDKEKFFKWADALSKAIGNPLYHWSHLELKRYFGFEGTLNRENAQYVWDMCNEKLASSGMSARGIINKSNVKLICTTDDPVDSLEWHKAIAECEGFDTKVLPAFRPDKAMNLEAPDYPYYIKKLSEISGIAINSFEDLKEALKIRIDYFASMGLKITDHGITYVPYRPASDDEIDGIFKKRLEGIVITEDEEARFKTAFMIFMGQQCSRNNLVMQLHYGCLRNNNSVMHRSIGADTGFDCIGSYTPASQLTGFLNALIKRDILPKTILYSLNPNDNPIIDTVAGCFADSRFAGTVQHGCAWWFNDNKDGIRNHLLSLASLGNLSGFIGMLTDSRSFLSYTRHEYFRRILCDITGSFVENGEFPDDEAVLKEIVCDISYNNAVKYFGFEL